RQRRPAGDGSEQRSRACTTGGRTAEMEEIEDEDPGIPGRAGDCGQGCARRESRGGGDDRRGGGRRVAEAVATRGGGDGVDDHPVRVPRRWIARRWFRRLRLRR